MWVATTLITTPTFRKVLKNPGQFLLSFGEQAHALFSVRFELDSILGLHDEYVGSSSAHGGRGGGREAAGHGDHGGGHRRRLHHHPLLPHLLHLLLLPAVFPSLQALSPSHLFWHLSLSPFFWPTFPMQVFIRVDLTVNWSLEGVYRSTAKQSLILLPQKGDLKSTDTVCGQERQLHNLRDQIEPHNA